MVATIQDDVATSRSIGVSRMDALIGESYMVKEFRDLPVSHQLAIAHYMAIDGEAWDVLFDTRVALTPLEAKRSLSVALPAYVQEYGSCRFGTLDIPVDAIKQSLLADEELASTFSDWDAYHTWYLESVGAPEHPSENRWPVILAANDDETLQDGSHRLHSYIRAGHVDIPAVFFAERRHDGRLTR